MPVPVAGCRPGGQSATNRDPPAADLRVSPACQWAIIHRQPASDTKSRRDWQPEPEGATIELIHVCHHRRRHVNFE